MPGVRWRLAAMIASGKPILIEEEGLSGHEALRSP